MSALETPKWAFERAFVLANADGVPATDLSTWTAAINAFAAYIAAHEEPPVDPLLIEARKLVADRFSPHANGCRSAILAGDEDSGQAVQNALTALKRGIELAKTGGDQI